MRTAARVVFASLCALLLHVALAALTVACGWMSPDGKTLPELDLSSVELSFSESPDDSAAPSVVRPAASEPPPESAMRPPAPPAPPAMELPPDHSAVPLPAPPRRDSLSPDVPEAPEPKPPEPPPEKAPEPKPRPLEPPRPAAAPSLPAPSQARVEAVKPPAPRRRIKPDYPKGARERREEGDVTLELRVDAEGMVEDVKVFSSCGFAELEAAAVVAVRKARFAPARQGGRAVPASARITLRFRLKE